MVRTNLIYIANGIYWHELQFKLNKFDLCLPLFGRTKIMCFYWLVIICNEILSEADPGFPRGTDPQGSSNLLFGQIFPKNAWKMKKLDRRGSKILLCKSATEYEHLSVNIYIIYDFIFTHNEFFLINTLIIQTSAFKASEHVNYVNFVD